MAAWRAACTEFDRRSHISEDELNRLRIGETLVLWTPDKVRSAIAGDFSSAASSAEALGMAAKSRAELQELLVLTLRRDLQFEEASRDTRIHELFALAYADEANAPEEAASEGGDPISTAISRHKAAYAAWLPHLRAVSEIDSADPRCGEVEAASNRPYEQEEAAYRALSETMPTTFAGLVALADYLPGAVLRNAVVDADNDALRALRAVCSAVKEISSADAGLVALGRRFDALHADWRQAEKINREPAARCKAAMDQAMGLRGDRFEAAARAAWAMPGVTEAHEAAEKAFEALDPLCEEIWTQPALTARGFAVQARTLIWALWPACDYEEGSSAAQDENFDRQCVRKYINNICAAAGVDWRGQPLVGQPNPSAAVSLADQILACWRDYGSCVAMGDEEESEATRALSERRFALIDAAEALPPTRENVTAKALALAWLGYVDSWEGGRERDAYGLDGRLAVDIDTAVCGRLLTEF